MYATAWARYPWRFLLASDAARWVDGISWHGYAGSPTLEGRYQARGFEQHNTEYRTFVSEVGTTAMAKIASDWTITPMRNGARSITMWNLALRRDGTPTLQSKGRQGVVGIDGTTAADVTRHVEFWLLSHFGRAVRVGAVRIGSTTYGQGRSSRTLQSLAFLDKGGAVALAVFTTPRRGGRSPSSTPSAGRASPRPWCRAHSPPSPGRADQAHPVRSPASGVPTRPRPATARPATAPAAPPWR